MANPHARLRPTPPAICRFEAANSRFATYLEAGTHLTMDDFLELDHHRERWLEALGRPGEIPREVPIAAILGCSDARVPIARFLDCGANELLEVRLAGNVLSDESLGSLEYAMTHLSERLECLIVLGHTHCGAVAAAVDAYANPARHISRPADSIIRRILPAVRLAAAAMRLSGNALSNPFRQSRDLIVEAAVLLNAAMAARQLREISESDRILRLPVFYGVYHLADSQVKHVKLNDDLAMWQPGFTPAPGSERELMEIAEIAAARLMGWNPDHRHSQRRCSSDARCRENASHTRL